MYNPFTIDDDQDRMDFNLAIGLVHEELLNTTYEMENEMTAPAKKSLTKKAAPEAEVKPTKAAKAAPAKTKAPAAKAAPAEKATRTREIPEGMVSLAALADELGILPGALRRKLRGADLTKPEGSGWMWKEGSKDLDKVRKMLTSA